jgi:hypothetical protein
MSKAQKARWRRVLEQNQTLVRSKNPLLEMSTVLRLAAKSVSQDWKHEDRRPTTAPKRQLSDCQQRRGKMLRIVCARPSSKRASTRTALRG